MKEHNTIVVYYSFEGNTEYVAEKIAAEMKADLLKLKPRKEPARTGLKKYFEGGKSTLKGERVKLEKFDVDFNQYDTVVIGSPVWAGTFPPAINSFLFSVRLKGKRIFLFGTSASGNDAKMIEKLTDRLNANNDVAAELSVKSPVTSVADEDILEFCETIRFYQDDEV